MCWRKTKDIIAVAAIVVLIGIGLSRPAAAQIPTTDAANLSQMVMQVQNSLQQINQLEQQIQMQMQQVQMQQSMVRSLGSDNSAGVQGLLNKSQLVLAEIRNAQALGGSLNQAIDQQFPNGFNGNDTSAITQKMDAINQAQRSAIMSAWNLQNTIASTQAGTSGIVNSTIQASNAASGVTGAVQATNQLLGVMATQNTQTQQQLHQMAVVEYQRQLKDQAQKDAEKAWFKDRTTSNVVQW